MKKTLCGILNGVYGILCLIYFLVQNGDIVFPGTIENGWFTQEFSAVLKICRIVIVILGIMLVVYDFRVVNDAETVCKRGIIISLVCALADCMFILVSAQMSIFCIGNIIGAVVILVSKDG